MQKNKIDKRKKNGGARAGAGAPTVAYEDKIVPIYFGVKRKHIEIAKATIKPILDDINSK